MTPIREKALRARFFARIECLKLGHILTAFRFDGENDKGESWTAHCMACNTVCSVKVTQLETVASLTGGWTRCGLGEISSKSP